MLECGHPDECYYEGVNGITGVSMDECRWCEEVDGLLAALDTANKRADAARKALDGRAIVVNAGEVYVAGDLDWLEVRGGQVTVGGGQATNVVIANLHESLPPVVSNPAETAASASSAAPADAADGS